jgi:hypothetical protein
MAIALVVVFLIAAIVEGVNVAVGVVLVVTLAPTA